MRQRRCLRRRKDLQVLSTGFLSDFTAAFVMRAFALAFGDALQLVEEFDLFFIVTDLHVLVVDDDRTLQNRRILNDEIAQFIDRHRFDIDIAFLDNLGTFGNDIICSVFRTRKQILDFILVQQGGKDVFLDIF